MKRIIFAILLVVVNISAVRSQQTQFNSEVYILGTSEPNTGFVRISHNAPTSKLHVGAEHFFEIESKEKGFLVNFLHLNYNLPELIKKRPLLPGDAIPFVMLTRPRSELASYANVVDVDQLIATKTKEEVWAWARLIRNKKIYIIDRNDFFTENGVQKMKLIEVCVSITNEPHDSPIITVE